MVIYQLDAGSALSGPVQLPLVPGFGHLLPEGFVQLSKPLPAPKPGHAWAMGETVPEQRLDMRGTVYHTTTGNPIQHCQLGPLPAGLTSTPRPSPEYVWCEGAWAKSAEFLYDAAVLEINRACEAAITAGFWSDALGDRRQYDSQIEDQLNLTGVILSGQDSLYGCRDELGLKAFLPHTFQQLRQVGHDMTMFRQQLLQRANTLKQRLDDALANKDVEALESVTWESEQ